VRHRQIAGLLAFLGLVESLYLTLQRFGFLGALACGPGGGCERVQASRFSEFLGVPVAVIGLAGYLVLFAVALWGLHGRDDDPAPTRLLVLLSGAGVVFSLYLTYLELFVIHAICRWCVGSAVIITAVFVASLAGLRGRAARSVSAGT
jgi:uncharacterized membrane protein